jgi:hypothetical protein
MKIVIGKFCTTDSITREQKIAIMTNPKLIEIVDKLNKIYFKSKFGRLLKVFDKTNPNIDIIDMLEKNIKTIMFNMLKITYYYNDLKIENVAKNRPFEIINDGDFIWAQYMNNKQNVFTL